MIRNLLRSPLPVQLDRHPWDPHPDADMVFELDRWDIPLAGLMTFNQRTFMFTCLIGEVDEDSLWVYAPVSKSEERGLRSLTESDLVGAIEGALRSRWVTVALSAEDEIAIVLAMWSERRSDGLGIARKFIRRVRAKLRTQAERDHVESLRRRPELAFS